MAATSPRKAEDAAHLNELVDRGKGWRVLGNWLPIKKLEIVVGPYQFESLRASLEELALADLEVSEVRAFGRTSSKKHFSLRGTYHTGSANEGRNAGARGLRRRSAVAAFRPGGPAG